jgi:ribA/ribD-fused uncharacterized protein
MGEPTAEELKRFYDERSKITKYDRFRYDEQGNLTEYNTKGALVKTIVLPTYRPPTEDERIQMEQERKDAIAQANRTLEDAQTRLYSAIQSHASEQEILEENDKVRVADIMLQNIRFPLRQTTMETGIKIRDIYFDQVQETRVFPYPIAFSHIRPFTLQQQYARVGDIPLPPMVSVAEATAAVEEPVILFSDQDSETSPYGFLALNWPVSIPIKDKIYKSARHAIFAELAMEFNDKERAAAIEAADSDIHYSVDDVAGGREVNQLQWNKKLSYLINLVHAIKFKNYPELAQRLVETGRAVIGAYEPNDLQIGIGLSMDNVKAKDKLAWTGENMLGKALMKIRDLIVAERIAAQPVKRVRKPRSAASASAIAAPSASAIAAPSAAPIAAPNVALGAAPNVAPSAAPPVAPIAPPSVRRGPRVAPQ